MTKHGYVFYGKLVQSSSPLSCGFRLEAPFARPNKMSMISRAKHTFAKL